MTDACAQGGTSDERLPRGESNTHRCIMVCRLLVIVVVVVVVVGVVVAIVHVVLVGVVDVVVGGGGGVGDGVGVARVDVVPLLGVAVVDGDDVFVVVVGVVDVVVVPLHLITVCCY